MNEEVKIMSNLLKQFENKQIKQEGIPEYFPGDTVEVKIQIEEGNRVRTQAFEGVERTFNIHSPLVKSITVKRSGKVRQAKLYYIRDLTAKKARIPEKRKAKKASDAKTEG